MINSYLTREVDGNLDGGLAGLDVETQAIESLGAANEGVVTLAAGPDGRASAGVVGGTADLEAGNGQPVSSGNDGRGVETGPATVGEVANITLDPGRGELANVGQLRAASAAGTAELRVGVDSEDLLATGGEVELQSLMAAEETVNLAIGSDLVPARAGRVVASVVENHGVLVLVEEVALNRHQVASVRAAGADIALVSDLSIGSTLAVTTAEGSVGGRARADTSSRAGSLLSRRSGSRRRRSRNSGRRRSGSGSGDGLNRLVGNDKVAAGLERVVGALVSVAARVSRGAEGGEEDGGGGELHVGDVVKDAV